jgi:hypothetical protein
VVANTLSHINGLGFYHYIRGNLADSTDPAGTRHAVPLPSLLLRS